MKQERLNFIARKAKFCVTEDNRIMTHIGKHDNLSRYLRIIAKTVIQDCPESVVNKQDTSIKQSRLLAAAKKAKFCVYEHRIMTPIGKYEDMSYHLRQFIKFIIQEYSVNNFR